MSDSQSVAVAAPNARHRVGGMLAVAAFLCLTPLVFAPAQIYYGNVTEFANAFPDMLRLLAATALLGTVLLTAVLVALPSGRIRDAGITALVTVAFLFWLQSTVLVWPYGVLDGRPIDWAAHRHHGLIDATVWCLVLAAAAVASRFVSRIAVRASVAFILIQAIGVSIQAARSPDRWIDHVAFDDSERFSFSHDRNVVILVLDTLQSDLFQELLDEDPGIGRRFRGFTYFRNAVGGFPGTAASIPLILSGRYYDNAVPFQEFVKSTYRTASLPKALKDAGFHVYYNNRYYWPCLYADETIASHVREKAFVRFDSELWPMARRLLGFGLSRSLPQAGKRFLDGNRLLSLPARSAAATPLRGDALFFKGIADGAATMKTPAFKYYHLWGIHPPLAHDENLQPRQLPFTRENAKRQAKGILRELETVFGALSDRGIYDRTLLFIVGDHGTSFDPRLVEVDGRVRTQPSAIAEATEHSFALPLVLVKPLGAVEPMKVSDTPVSLSDIPATAASVLGLQASFPGESMLSPDLPIDRQRRVLKYHGEALRLTDQYFPPLTEFVVAGFSWFEESWRLTGREFVPGETRSIATAQSYLWGQPVRFGLNGNAQPYLAQGWAAPEGNFTWTQGRKARLRFMTQVPTGDLRVRARVVPALLGGLRRQRAGLFVGGRKVGEWSVESAGEYTSVIPRELVTGGELEIVFALPDAVAPGSVLRDSLDQRLLALAVTSLVLEETDPAIAPPR